MKKKEDLAIKQLREKRKGLLEEMHKLIEQSKKVDNEIETFFTEFKKEATKREIHICSYTEPLPICTRAVVRSIRYSHSLIMELGKCLTMFDMERFLNNKIYKTYKTNLVDE